MADKNNKTSTKDLLLKAAEEFFTERGYAAVSTRELAEKAGVNLGAIQYHFGSKTQLFVETIRNMMSRQKGAVSVFSEGRPPETREEAAVDLFFLVRGFVSEMCHPKGPDACRVMHREVLGATSQNAELLEVLVSSVVDEFFCPFDDDLMLIVRLLAPNVEERELEMVAHSIYGQCSFYPMDKPYIERIRGIDYTKEPYLLKVCEHIASFTLKGLGFSEVEIETALKCVKEKGNYKK